LLIILRGTIKYVQSLKSDSL